MSSALGIASVTHVLKDLLNNGLVLGALDATVGAVKVSSIAPKLLENSEQTTTPTQLNLFLYRVTHNTGWSNVELPSRNHQGERTRNPPLALDLHYLLTAFGDSELHAEILLGHGMQIFHEHPVLDREEITTSLTTAEAGNGGTLPEDLRDLSTSGLAEQIELLKITPEQLNTEEMSKLWTAFQTGYRPCTAYQVTVVLIESREPAATPLPVETRQIISLPISRPVIDRVCSRENETAPIREGRRIQAGDTLVLQGTQLKGEDTKLQIDGQSLSGDSFLQLTSDQISLVLPADLRIGLHSVQVLHQLDGSRTLLSAPKAFVLHPEITQVSPQDLVASGSDVPLLAGTIDIKVQPAVAAGQRVALRLHHAEAISDQPAGHQFSQMPPAADTDELTFTVDHLHPGEFWVRLQVDGTDSAPFGTITLNLP